jgi:hypothetical protein
MQERYLFPEDEAQASMDDAARARRPKREFHITTREEMSALIIAAVAAGTYDPNRTDNHTCELCGAAMEAIHYKTLDGSELCQLCAWTKGGCDCPVCERSRAEEWARLHPMTME